ncbi:MAG: FAD:protein FMN transferase [Bacteroidota bacterium]
MRYLFVLSAAFLACQGANYEPIELSGPAQGSSYRIVYDAAQADPLQSAVDSIFQKVNEALSTYHEGSLILQFNAEAELATDNALFIEMVSRSRDIATLTEGAFDPTVMPLVRAWGFGPDNALVPKIDNLDSLRQFVGMAQIEQEEGRESHIFRKRQSGVQLDFNAIAQGYTVDLLGRILEARGLDNYFVEVGGEILTKGENPQGKAWTIGIEKPIDIAGISELATLVRVSDQAVATSGNYRKFYEKDGIRYSHTIDPATGRPVQHSLLSTTVLASDCATADAFATAFMVMGLEKAQAFLAKHPELELEAYFILGLAPGNYDFVATNGMEERLLSAEE